MIIVGLTGEIESGKSTFAEFLAERSTAAAHWESWQLIAEVAEKLRNGGQAYPPAHDLTAINEWLEPLPAIVQEVAHREISATALRLTPGKLKEHPEYYEKLFQHLADVKQQPALQTEPITAVTKETFRPLLQWLGGFLIILSDDGLWYDEILRRIAERPNLELATIGGVRYPGESTRIQAAGGQVLRIVRPKQQRRDANDLTERQNDQIPVSSTVVNNASLEQLKNCSVQLFHDLQANQLASEYLASAF